MAYIKDSVFGPMLPKIDPELLPEKMAQLAQNLKHTSGAMDGWRLPSAVAGVSMPGASQIKTLYRYGKDSVSRINYWMQFTGDVDILKGPVNTDTEERTYWTDGQYPKKTKSSLAGLTAGVAITPASLRMGVPPPGWMGPVSINNFTPIASVSGVATDATSTPITSTYVWTYVSSWGEESMPGNASNIVVWRAGQTVTITAPGAIGGPYDITKVKLYRSSTGTSRTTFQAVGLTSAVGITSRTDTTLPDALGEVCPTWDWAPPGDGMIGLTDMGNGILAGFEKNTVSFCEPYYPYAWPAKYDVTVSALIIGLASFGQTLVVGTTEGVVLLSGIDPAAMTQESPKGSQSCSSKRSIVEMLGGVVYAGPDGLILAGPSGPMNLTEGILSRDEWQSYDPSSIDGYTIDGRYYAFYSNGSEQACLIFSFGADAGMVRCDQYITAGYVEQSSDSLFVVSRSGSTNTLLEWNSGAKMSVQWKSKDYRFFSGVCMSRAKVVADGYPLTLTMHLDSVEQPPITVLSKAAFALPDGRSDTVSYEINSTHKVMSVRIATSMVELGDG